LTFFNPLNPELNSIWYLLALLGAHHFLHVSRIRVKSLTLRVLMSYIYIYDISSLGVNKIRYRKKERKKEEKRSKERETEIRPHKSKEKD